MPFQKSQLQPSNSTTDNAFSSFKNLQYQLNYLAWLLGSSASPKELWVHPFTCGKTRGLTWKQCALLGGKKHRLTHWATKYKPIIDCRVHHMSNAVWLKIKLHKNLQRIWKYSNSIIDRSFQWFQQGQCRGKRPFWVQLLNLSMELLHRF